MNQPIAPVAKATAVIQGVMRPLAFDGLFGWLHQRLQPGPDVGVVLVSSIGRDARCAHRPMRLFADRLAESGFPTLRYDHRGTGDSLDLEDRDVDATAVWLADLRQAISILRRQAGVRRVVLGGVRLGATLAAASAVEADGLILLAPVLNGRSWLRRRRFPLKGPLGESDDQGLDADGVLLSASSAQSLGEIDLTTRVAPTVPVFLAAQNRMVEAYAGRLTAGAVTLSDFPGFRDLFLDAHSNRAPTDLFDAACKWMEATFGESGLASRPALAEPAILRPPGGVELAVEFGAGLRGVLCEPQGRTVTPCVVFCNTGGDPRAGIGGFSTAAARALAEHGVASLRFDLAGLGDSDAPDGQVRPHVYETPREADFDAALSFIEQQGLGPVTMVGVCAGAFHALRTGWRDPRVTGVFAISPVKLVWSKGDSLSFGRGDHGKATQHYRKAAFDGETWRRLIEGQIDLVAVGRTLHGRSMRRLANLARRRDRRSPLDETRRFHARGGRTGMLMGLDDASLDEVEAHFGPGGVKLTALAGGSVEVLPELDHGLARSHSRREALASLLRWLGLDAETA